MRPVRILVFVQTALALVFTYSLFPRLTPAGILVFVQTASHRRWRGNPVNKTCRAATQYLNFAL